MKKETPLFYMLLIASCFILSFLAVAEGNPVKNDAGKSFPKPKIAFAPKHYLCYRTEAPIKIDGKLNEAVWNRAEWTDDFVDIEGHLKPKPRFRTRAKMLWDDEYLYFAAELIEPHVWATLMQRDTVIFYDNDFEVFIDPDGDTHQYYEFEMNALGTEWDLFLVAPYRDGGPPVTAWDIQGLKTAVSVQGTINDPTDMDRGWTLEIAMPWKVLKECARQSTPPQSGDQWRINFSRVEWQVEINNGKYQKRINPKTGRPFREDNWVWSPQGLINMHYPEMWGFVQFSDKIAGQGTDAFQMKDEEFVKWALREIYYKQKEYYLNHGTYTDHFPATELKRFRIKGYQFPPTIRVTPHLFEANVTSIDGSMSWSICQDGRVWQTLNDK